MSKQKYKQGKMIRSITDFAKSKSKWFKVYFGCKPKTTHISFLISWQYRTLELFISRGFVYEADKIEYPKPCSCCNRRPIRKLHFKPGEDRNRSINFTYLVCPKCGTRTDAYSHEYQSTRAWNEGKVVNRGHRL